MRLYAEYLMEYDGFSLLEREHGYATYRVQGEECYIKEMYVEKAFRKAGYGSEMVDAIAEVARAQGCKCLVTTVYDNQLNQEIMSNSIHAQLRHGFKIHKFHENFAVLIKEIL